MQNKLWDTLGLKVENWTNGQEHRLLHNYGSCEKSHIMERVLKIEASS